MAANPQATRPCCGSRRANSGRYIDCNIAVAAVVPRALMAISPKMLRAW